MPQPDWRRFASDRDGFVAGVDVLGLGLGAAAILGIAAVFAARRAKPTEA